MQIGAGIQIPPNSSRLMIRWGLEEKFAPEIVKPKQLNLLRWKDGKQIGLTPFDPFTTDHYGAPYWHVHRADYHRILMEAAIERGVDLRVNAPVAEYIAEKGQVKLVNGEIVQGDLVIACDGLKSKAREKIVGVVDNPRPTGDAAYRATFQASQLLADPDLKDFIENPCTTGWMGPDKHVMAYCIKGRKLYNLVLLCPDDMAEESWTAPGDVNQMRKEYEGWDPRLVKLLNLVPSTLKWKLCAREPLPTWIHSSNKLVLLGDSCHPMLPYQAQGAAQATEDAAVLGNLLSKIGNDASQIPAVLKVYEQVRLPRATQIQTNTVNLRHTFHLHDGPEQEARDRAMGADMADRSDNPNLFAGAQQAGLYGYDADSEADKAWAAYHAQNGQTNGVHSGLSNAETIATA